MSELERLEKNVVDTATADMLNVADWASRTTYDDTAWTAYRKALQELEDYLKEQVK
tara:strand:+ start:819 stop:986 length:168 start_codon:yes stop_codon:yes gene_type:complete